MFKAHTRLRVAWIVLLIILMNLNAMPTYGQTNSINPRRYPIRGVVHIAVSSNGQYIAAGSSDTGLYLLNSSGASLWNFSPPLGQQGMKSVAISADGKYLAAGQDDEGGNFPAGVYLFSRNSSIPLWRNESGDIVWSVGISSDGQYVTAGGWYHNRKIQLFSRESGTPLWSYVARSGVKSVAISSDGQYVAAGSDDHRLYVFNRNSSTPLWNYTEDGYIETVAISSDSQYVVAGSGASSVSFFERDNPKPLWKNPIGGIPLCVAISADGQYIAVGTGELTYGVFLLNRANKRLWFYSTSSNIESVAISPDGQYIAAGGDDQMIYFFKRDSNVPIWTYNAKDTVWSVAISSNASSVVAGGAGDVILFNNATSIRPAITTTVPPSTIPQTIPQNFVTLLWNPIVSGTISTVAGGVILYLLFGRRKKPEGVPDSRKLDDTDESTIGDWNPDGAPDLDPRFLHVYAVLFYPDNISWEKGERTPVRYMPRYKAIINGKTNKAFYMAEYAIDLLNRRKIQWITTSFGFPLTMEQALGVYFVAERGMTLVKRPANRTDLLEGTTRASRILAWLVFLVRRGPIRNAR